MGYIDKIVSRSPAGAWIRSPGLARGYYEIPVTINIEKSVEYGYIKLNKSYGDLVYNSGPPGYSDGPTIINRVAYCESPGKIFYPSEASVLAYRLPKNLLVNQTKDCIITNDMFIGFISLDEFDPIYHVSIVGNYVVKGGPMAIIWPYNSRFFNSRELLSKVSYFIKTEVQLAFQRDGWNLYKALDCSGAVLFEFLPYVVEPQDNAIIEPFYTNDSFFRIAYSPKNHYTDEIYPEVVAEEKDNPFIVLCNPDNLIVVKNELKLESLFDYADIYPPYGPREIYHRYLSAKRAIKAYWDPNSAICCGLVSKIKYNYRDDQNFIVHGSKSEVKITSSKSPGSSVTYKITVPITIDSSNATQFLHKYHVYAYADSTKIMDSSGFITTGREHSFIYYINAPSNTTRVYFYLKLETVAIAQKVKYYYRFDYLGGTYDLKIPYFFNMTGFITPFRAYASYEYLINSTYKIKLRDYWDPYDGFEPYTLDYTHKLIPVAKPAFHNLFNNYNSRKKFFTRFLDNDDRIGVPMDPIQYDFYCSDGMRYIYPSRPSNMRRGCAGVYVNFRHYTHFVYGTFDPYNINEGDSYEDIVRKAKFPDQIYFEYGEIKPRLSYTGSTISTLDSINKFTLTIGDVSVVAV
ncbi:MAG: hypothetical protein QXV44_02370 [Candidatus Anstonellaceae archaeon]